MEIGLVGLGKMGHALALNMFDQGHRVTGFSTNHEKAEALTADGVKATVELDEFTVALGSCDAVWLMVPAGEPVDQVINQVVPFLRAETIIVDGGNSHYRDSVRRAIKLKERGFQFIDVGISGGPSGARHGACMMVGAEVDTYATLEPLFKDLCVENGCLRVGENGSGHYVKMIHNGIEYGMLQAIAEGFELLEQGPYPVDYRALSNLWNNGSVIRSWLIKLTEQVFATDPHLEQIKGLIGSSGTGLWTVEEALTRKVPLPVITQALYARYRSEQDNVFSARLVAALRQEFGGHYVEKS
ncbi:MAG: decarboxylating 6-phosphogluconate dehydrogenase [Bacillota bacterium]